MRAMPRGFSSCVHDLRLAAVRHMLMFCGVCLSAGKASVAARTSACAYIHFLVPYRWNTGGDYRLTLRPSVRQSVSQSVRQSICLSA